MNKEEHTIDAAGQRIGRVASEAARLLMGKHRIDYAPNKVAPVRVIIANSDQLLIGEEKREQKLYSRYTGYPGGLRQDTLETVLEKKGAAEVIQRAVRGMLPSNKLRNERLKNLEIQA